MAAVLRIKLIDLLRILLDRSPAAHEPNIRQRRLFTSPVTASKTERSPLEEDLAAIKQYLQTSGPAGKRDLAMVLNMGGSTMLHRLNLLKEHGVVVDLPGHKYELAGVAQ